MMIPQSIRWRLPLSYAAIAFVATLALGAVLLTTLRNYYSRAELDYLESNARAIGAAINYLAADPVLSQNITEPLQTFAFLSQTRVQLLDADKNILHDTGLPDDNVWAFDRRRSIAPSGQPAQGTNAPDSSQNRTWVFALQNADEAHLGSAGAADRFTIEILSSAVSQTQPLDEDHRLLPPIERPPEDQLLFFPARRTLFGFDFNDTTAALRPPIRRSGQVTEMPLPDNDTLIGFIRLSQGPAYGSEIVDSVAQSWVAASVIAYVLAAFIGLFISHRLTAPLLMLTQATTQMTAGDLSARARITSRDEVGTLAQSFNEMANRVEETIVTLRRFVADAAHELHTPLTALRTNLELLASEPRDPQRARFAEQALIQVQRLETLTTDLLELSRLEAITNMTLKKPVNLTRLIQETSELYASQADQRDIAYDLDLPGHAIYIVADDAQIRRALGNLLENALKFTPESGAISVRLTTNSPGNVEICVQDTGIGIPADDLNQLFSRFHRARNAAAFPGSGLGLAIVKAITDANNGTIMVEPLADGTRFMLRLPSSPPSGL